MRRVIHAGCRSALFAVLALNSCKLETAPVATGPEAAVKVMNLLQGADNASIGFDSGRPLSLIAFPSIAPTEAGSYFFVPAGTPRQLRVLLTTATVLDSTVTFAVNQYYTIVTTGTRGASGAAAPSFIVLQNNVAAVSTGSVRFRFVQGSSTTGRVDVHVTADTAAFASGSPLLANVPYRGSATIEARIAGNQKLCIIATGTPPTATGANCIARQSFGVSQGVGMTAALRDAASTETAPGLLLTIDRTP